MPDETAFLEGWQSDPRTRRQFVAELTRELSKTRRLETFQPYLMLLAEHLSKADATNLFAELQQSKRPESEWKHEFLEIFLGVSESDLPPPIVDEEDARRIVADSRNNSKFGQPQAGFPDVPF